MDQIWQWFDTVFLRNPGGWAALITACTAYKLKDAAQQSLKSRLYIRRAAETERAFKASFKFTDALLTVTDPFLTEEEATNPDEVFPKRFALIRPDIEEMYGSSISAQLFLPPEIWEKHKELMNQWPEIRAAFINWQASKQAGSAMSHATAKHFHEFMGHERRRKLLEFKSSLAGVSRSIVNFEKSTLRL